MKKLQFEWEYIQNEWTNLHSKEKLIVGVSSASKSPALGKELDAEHLDQIY
jgi:hypothetical protein